MSDKPKVPAPVQAASQVKQAPFQPQVQQQQPQKDWTGPIASLALSLVDKNREVTQIQSQLQDLNARLTQIGQALQESHRLNSDAIQKLQARLEPEEDIEAAA